MALMMVTLGVGLVGCSGNKETTKPKEQTKKEETKKDDEKYVGFVTDVGSIDDKSFNEGSWNGVKGFAEKNGYKCDFFRPVADTEEARAEAFDKAIDAGADVVVCVGYLFESVVYNKQNQYKDVEIVFVDGEPKDKDGNVSFNNNTSTIMFKEEESGYLAGYATVKEGYKKLGFLGGIDIPAVRRFGYGYVQGAEAAAKEMNVRDVTIEYMYAGGFTPSDDITNNMKKWYDAGTEIIFSCGGGILYSVIEAAGNDANRKIIGVDVDQAAESDKIVFSAMKGLTESISTALQVYEDNGGKWPEDRAGKKYLVGVKEDGVGLSAVEGSWRVKNTTIDQYNAMIESMKKTDLKIEQEELPTLNYVKVNKIN